MVSVTSCCRNDAGLGIQRRGNRIRDKWSGAEGGLGVAPRGHADDWQEVSLYTVVAVPCIIGRSNVRDLGISLNTLQKYLIT